MQTTVSGVYLGVDLRVWDNGGRNIKLDQAEFIDMGPLSGNSRLNKEAFSVKKGVKCCLNDRLERLSKDGLLKMSWRCQTALGSVLMKRF